MVSYKRHLLKTISWRIIGTMDTMMLSSIITGSWKIGIAIGGVEVITKMVLYYLHERAWYKFSKFGINENINNGKKRVNR